MSAASPVFVALIATCNRPALLARRALPSVAAQTRKPDLVVVADDSLPQFRARNKKTAESFSDAADVQVLYVENKRCRGASGAWNTGALAAMRALGNRDLNRAYLSVLDDDDEWLPRHLAEAEHVLRQTGRRGADLMAAAFERREAKSHRIIEPPRKLNTRDFLVGNPGVVGSTLTVRLSAFLRAGMFDESLSACTDRDLCIRLSMLPGASYKPLPRTSAVHHAEETRPRLSSKGGAARLAGLSAFADKYRGWMSGEEYSAFCARARALFGWAGGGKKEKTARRTKFRKNKIRPAPKLGKEKIALVVGIIVHPGQNNSPLFSDILRLSKDARLSAADVVVMPSSGGGRALRSEMEKWRRAGLHMHCIDGARIKKFSPVFVNPADAGKVRSIAVNRTILQHAVSRFAALYRNPACWILDGDSRLYGLKTENNGVVKYKPDYAGEMIRLRNTGCDAAVGGVHGAAPLPRSFTVRSQMVDLFHMTVRLGASASDKDAPSATLANIEIKGAAENYYHDCLPQPYLERPAGLPPKKYTQKIFMQELPKLLERILAGDAVTRPLLWSGEPPARLHRGGNTLFFNSELLCECPNMLSRGGRAGIRRQDEIWRIMSCCAFNRKISAGNFPVAQFRGTDAPQAPDMERTAADIAGHAVVEALRAIAGGRRFGGAEEAADFLLKNDLLFLGEVRRAAEARLDMTRASFFRICGVASSMRAVIGKMDGGGASVRILDGVVRRFSPQKWRVLEKLVSEKLKTALLRRMLVDYPALCRDYGALRHKWSRWIKEERKKNALSLLSERGSVIPRFLGQGEEGTVAAVGQNVFKVLHRWYARKDVSDADFLPSFAKKREAGKLPYPILSARKKGGDLILTMPRQKTTPYNGGCGAGLAALLASLKNAGAVLHDVAPENFRRAGGEILPVDYGRDVRPFSAKDFDLSVRKAWLSWRWAFRKDLRALLTASLKNPDMPELDGYKNMKTAVERYAADCHPEDFAVEEALKYSPRNFLDYGCGGGGVAAAAAARRVQADAYDPNLTDKAELRLKSAAAGIIKNSARAEKKYDAVILRYVLCEIASDAELRECLRDVRRLTAPKGRVVATVCAPGGVVKNTMRARAEMPRRAGREEKFYYRKRIHATGRCRAHVHRPESVLEREFARSGFRAASRRVFPCMDLDRFEPVDGAVRWVLTPLPPRPPAALIIRACAMDSEFAEFQVRHLVRQLNYPRGFSEIILAVDRKTENFLRQYVPGNLPALLASARRLKKEGWIDRIITAPTAGEAVRKINKKYYGLDGAFTHALNDAPLLTPLFAFERCRAEYALHVDIDMVVGREDRRHDYLGGMLREMARRNAITMSLNLPGGSSTPKENKKIPFRLEVRAGLTNIAVLKKMLPLSADPGENGVPRTGWYRAADRLIARTGAPSLRGGNQKLFIVHPPNCFKRKTDAADILVNAAEAGFYPESQKGKNEWDGGEEEWLLPPRREKFVFIICGCNVPPGKIDRCLDSVAGQTIKNWGAVLADDASSHACAARLRRWSAAHSRRVTYFARRKRAGGLANLSFAVRRLCADPESVIVTLDMDDALLGGGVLARLEEEYRRGADMTVGSMLRSDKHKEYPVCFDNPRARRGGNVWQHLRSFKKRLFDAVPDSALRNTAGNYFSLAEDWAYMIPMAELAARPVWIRDPLYFYEPDVRRKKRQKNASEAAAAEIIRGRVFGAKK